MIKKFLSTTIAITVTALLLAGCGSSSEPSTESSTESKDLATDEISIEENATEETSEHGFTLDHDPVSIGEDTGSGSSNDDLLKSDFSVYKGINCTEAAPGITFDYTSITDTSDGFSVKIEDSGITAHFSGEHSVGEGEIVDNSECYKLSGVLSDFVYIDSSLDLNDLASGKKGVEEIWIKEGHSSLELDTDNDGEIDTRLIISAGSEVTPDTETELTWKE